MKSDQCLYYLLLQSFISKFATCKISIFLLVSVAEQLDLRIKMKTVGELKF